MASGGRPVSIGHEGIPDLGGWRSAWHRGRVTAGVLPAMTPMDPYSVLGVAPSAGPDEVKAAYRARARLVHPDFHRDARGGAPQAAHDAFAQLCSAYQLALGNLASTRTTLQSVDDSLGRAAPSAHPAVPRPRAEARGAAPAAQASVAQGSAAQASTALGPAAAEPFDWRGTFLLLGLLALGWLFVAEWLPALMAYSST